MGIDLKFQRVELICAFFFFFLSFSPQFNTHHDSEVLFRLNSFLSSKSAPKARILINKIQRSCRSNYGEKGLEKKKNGIIINVSAASIFCEGSGREKNKKESFTVIKGFFNHLFFKLLATEQLEFNKPQNRTKQKFAKAGKLINKCRKKSSKF